MKLLSPFLGAKLPWSLSMKDIWTQGYQGYIERRDEQQQSRAERGGIQQSRTRKEMNRIGKKKD